MTGQGMKTSSETAEGYLVMYGLAREPFGDETPPSFFYPGATREQRLNLLLHLVPLGEILLITGEDGAGKSVLLEQFIARGKESWRICRLDATEGLDSSALVQQLAQRFSPEALELIKQPQTDRAEIERLLIAQLQGLRKSAQQPMLLIDNAHNISESAFRALSRFIVEAPEDEKLLGIVLFSKPEIEEKLSNPALQSLRSQIKHTFELPLLSEGETSQYLGHRMQAAGFRGDSPFTEAVNRAVFGASKGLPRKINELAQAVLQNKRNNSEPQVSTGEQVEVTTPEKRTKSGTFSVTRYWPFVAAAVLASVLLFQDEINSLFTPPTENQQITKEAPAKLEIEQAQKRPRSDPAGGVGRDPAADLVSEPELVKTEPPVEASRDELSTDSLPTAPEKEVVAATAEEVTTEESSAVTAPAVQSIDVELQPLPVAEQVDEQQQAGAAVEQSPSDEDSSSMSEKPAPDSGNWVVAQRPESYTLQIVAQEKIEKREKFIARFGLERDVERFSTNKKGRRWYVAAIGVYGSRTAALEASRQLPDGVVAWVRSFGSIQKELWLSPDAGVKKQEVAVSSPASKVTETEPTEQERWVLARPEDHFVLQLVAFEAPAKTRAFIASHALEGDAKEVRLINKGRIWYVAVYGDATDRSEALDLADNLKDNKGISQSWARSYSSLQQAMREFQQK